MQAENDLLFKINKLKHDDGFIVVTLSINKESTIFKGHFPGHPVLPGACMLQLVKDVLAGALSMPLQLKKADLLKFLVLIDPTNTHTIRLDLSYHFSDEAFVNASAKIIDGEVNCFKFQGTFIRG